MAQGKVGVFAEQTGNGATKEVERTPLFIGVGNANIGSVQAIDSESDFATLFGADQPLTNQLEAWKRNADDLAFGYAVAINDADNIFEIIDKALDENVNPEFIVVCKPVTGKADVEAYENKVLSIKAEHALYLRILVAAPGIDNDQTNGQTWAEYTAALTPITDNIAAQHTAVVPLMHGDELGAVVGRLCKFAVTIADSPMRVATGPIALMPLPTDKDGKPLTNATTKALDAKRFSCPQWYKGFDGTYFGDVNLLDAEGGDFQRIEDGRVADKAARQVRIRALYQIRNRQFNDTPTGIEFGKRQLIKPLRAMAKSITLGDQKFPGEIKEPNLNDIGLSFIDQDTVRVAMKIKPFNSPRTILVGIILDRTVEV